MITALSRSICRLASAVGGAARLAERCGVRESAVVGWIAGDRSPTPDELFLLELVARRTGMVLEKATTRPPPRFSGIHRTDAVAAAGEAAAEGDEAANLSYEAYREWSKRRPSGDGGT